MKVLRIKKDECKERIFTIPKDDVLSEKFIMLQIKKCLTNDEGQFKLQSFSILIEDATNCASNLVKMAKIEDSLKEDINW